MKSLTPLLPRYFLPNGPGAVVAFASGSDLVWSECFGYADIDSGTAIDLDTIFDLASVTKIFTAAAVSLLDQRGQLRVDAFLSDYLPDINVQAKRRPVKLTDLLWHTSGIPDYVHVLEQSDLAKAAPIDVRGLVREWMPECEPGIRDEYSNTNYFLLAQVIEAVSGISYQAFLSSQLFSPLRLARTSVLGSTNNINGRARGYRSRGVAHPCYIRDELDIAILGDGGVLSSASDLVQWLDALFEGELLDGPALKRMISPGQLDDGTALDYGFGLIVEMLPNGRRWRGHTGGWNGTSTYFGRLLDDRTTLLVLSNDRDAPVVRIAQQLLLQNTEATNPGEA